MRSIPRVSVTSATLQRLFDSMVNRDNKGRPVLILTPHIDDGFVLADALMERGYGKLGEGLSKKLKAQQKRSPGWDRGVPELLLRIAYALDDIRAKDLPPLFSQHDLRHMTRLARKIISPPLRTRDRLRAFLQQGGFVDRQPGAWPAHRQLNDLLDEMGYDREARALHLAWGEMLSRSLPRGVTSYQATLARLGIFV